LDKDEEIIEAMMEDLAHFAYFMGCITKRDVKRQKKFTPSLLANIIPAGFVNRV
jgi:hypothetical protein